MHTFIYCIPSGSKEQITINSVSSGSQVEPELGTAQPQLVNHNYICCEKVSVGFCCVRKFVFFKLYLSLNHYWEPSMKET